MVTRRLLSSESKTSATKEASKEASKEATTSASSTEKKGWWSSAEFWGGLGALAGWGMSGSAIYDGMSQSPDIISLNMTGVLMVYSSLFARWAFIVVPQNLPLAACHATNVVAQGNQLRRAIEYKIENGEREEAEDCMKKAAAITAGGAACFFGGPVVQSALSGANIPLVSTVAAADAGPFTVHFWAPMSKWMISGASFLDLNRPTDKISITQYSALTATGLFFSRYALLVTPLNPMLCAVNVALFGSSAWHLGRKINADYIEEKK